MGLTGNYVSEDHRVQFTGLYQQLVTDTVKCIKGKNATKTAIIEEYWMV